MLLDPCVSRKPDPVTVTWVPTTPLAGLMPVIFGRGTVKLTFVLLVTPPTVVDTDPEKTPDGTVAVIRVSDQLTIEAAPIQKFSVLEPWVAPKLLPVTV